MTAGGFGGNGFVPPNLALSGFLKTWAVTFFRRKSRKRLFLLSSGQKDNIFLRGGG
jgi:hypothetical protein